MTQVSIPEGMPREQVPQARFVRASHAERGVEDTPAAPVDGRQAQVRRGEGTGTAVSKRSFKSKRISARFSKPRHRESRKTRTEWKGGAEETKEPPRGPT